MAKFSVTVEEIFTKRYEVEADDADDARRKVQESMSEGDEFCPSANSDAAYGNQVYDIYEIQGMQSENV